VDLKPGDVIDNKYEVEGAPLGRGGMGVVYLALYRQLGTHVALKFLHPRLVAKPDIVSRFLHEARAGMRIKSHHVARVHGVGTHEGAPFIVMEDLTGRDLDAVLKERGPLDEEVDECE
jgi:serine/threonine protein kinase